MCYKIKNEVYNTPKFSKIMYMYDITKILKTNGKTNLTVILFLNYNFKPNIRIHIRSLTKEFHFKNTFVIYL